MNLMELLSCRRYQAAGDPRTAQRSAAMAADRRAGSQRSPCRRTRAAAREAAERGVLPPGGAPARWHRQRPPKLGRPSRHLLPGRPVPLPGPSGRNRARAPSRALAGRRLKATSQCRNRYLDCCSCAPETAPAPRSPRLSSNIERRAPSKRAARAAIPSHCTRTRCGSWPSAVSTSRIARRNRSTTSRHPVRPRHHALRQGARDLRSVPRGADRRPLERRGPGRCRERRRGDVPTFQRVADEIESRVALLLADLTARPSDGTQGG